jgi:hypothetical protein
VVTGPRRGCEEAGRASWWTESNPTVAGSDQRVDRPVGAGRVTTAELVALPTGPVRGAAVLACAAVLLVLAFSGWAPLLALAVVAAAVGTRARPAGYREPAAISGLP